jgi:uncharacterized protein (TIGR03118 family)
MKQTSVRSLTLVNFFVWAVLLAESQAWCATVYVQTNLVSDVPGLAQATDPNLKNPWGVSFSATGPFWASNAASNTSTVYSGTGSTISPLVVTVPGGPTGQISNSTTDFLLTNGRKASFVFSTLSGGIYGWNSGTVAEQDAKLPNASFTGLALASNSSGNFLYASNISGGGSIEVFNASFQRVTVDGSFKDPNLPATPAYVPYNIQTINGQLYVEYASFQAGLGAVSIFDTSGNFVKELIAPGGPQLNQPWGIVLAPSGFGSFGGDLLVGNLGDGKINAFNPSTGAFLGTVSGFNGPLVNSGLWSLSVRTGGTFNQNAVYFMAGINDQTDGLFGVITPSSDSTPAITTASILPAGKIGTPYAQTLAVGGGAPPYSNWTITNGGLPPGLTLNSSTGTVSGAPVAVGATFSFTVSVTDSSGAKTFGSFQLTTTQAPTASTTTRIGSFAQLASGGGWKTTMALINLSASTVNAQINLYADNGNPLSLPLTFPEFAAGTALAPSIGLTLSPNDSIVIQSNASTPAIGMGWADVQATGPLSGYLIFSESTGALTTEGTAPLDSRLSTSLVLPYDNTNGYQTGVALANQASTSQRITVTVFDQSGAQLTSSQMTLPGSGHAAFFTGSQFTQSGNQLGVIQFQSSGGLTGVGLRFSPSGSFTSIPIIR